MTYFVQSDTVVTNLLLRKIHILRNIGVLNINLGEKTWQEYHRLLSHLCCKTTIKSDQEGHITSLLEAMYMKLQVTFTPNTNYENAPILPVIIFSI